MKQILVISGKGGTGKTVISGAFAALAGNSVLADCDVDAANLHLLLQPRVKTENEFKCGAVAVIDRKQCVRCGLCRDLCRFDAVTEDIRIDPVSCEGCGFCHRACPTDAIRMEETVSGEWFVSETRFGPFVHARLGIAQENSGKLVSLVKQQAQEIGEKQDRGYLIIDGAPGIGCPVIASLSGVDSAVVVTEPTLSGLHDAKRVIKVARHFNVPVKMVINKYDLSPETTGEIEAYFRERDIAVIGRVPFDRQVVEATVAGKTVVEYASGKLKRTIMQIWDAVK